MKAVIFTVAVFDSLYNVLFCLSNIVILASFIRTLTIINNIMFVLKIYFVLYWKFFSGLIKHVYFKFNDKIYIQCDGVAMGSPRVPIFANIFMISFEEKSLFIKQLKLTLNVNEKSINLNLFN